MAVLNNLMLGLLRRRGVDNLPDARRYYTANLRRQQFSSCILPLQSDHTTALHIALS